MMIKLRKLAQIKNSSTKLQNQASSYITNCIRTYSNGRQELGTQLNW